MTNEVFKNDYIQRMKNEREALLDKIRKLLEFTESKIYISGLDPFTKEVMMMQLGSMEVYARCLAVRIALSEKGNLPE